MCPLVDPALAQRTRWGGLAVAVSGLLARTRRGGRRSGAPAAFTAGSSYSSARLLRGVRSRPRVRQHRQRVAPAHRINARRLPAGPRNAPGRPRGVVAGTSFRTFLLEEAPSAAGPAMARCSAPTCTRRKRRPGGRARVVALGAGAVRVALDSAWDGAEPAAGWD